MADKKSLKTRVNNLENQQPEVIPKIVIDWSANPKHKPGDKIVEWDQDGEIRSYIVKKGSTDADPV